MGKCGLSIRRNTYFTVCNKRNNDDQDDDNIGNVRWSSQDHAAAAGVDPLGRIFQQN